MINFVLGLAYLVASFTAPNPYRFQYQTGMEGSGWHCFRANGPGRNHTSVCRRDKNECIDMRSDFAASYDVLSECTLQKRAVMISFYASKWGEDGSWVWMAFQNKRDCKNAYKYLIDLDISEVNYLSPCTKVGKVDCIYSKNGIDEQDNTRVCWENNK